MKAIFDTRPDTNYDDELIRYYHFPKRYLADARKCVGDWIIYREPRRGGGRQGYVAVAQVMRIEPDPADAGSFYAYLTSFLQFDEVVPLRRGTEYFETRLRSVEDSKQVGVVLRGKSIRTITDTEFCAVVCAGFRETLDFPNISDFERGAALSDWSVQAFIGASPEEQERRIAQVLANRPLRDAAFRTSVVKAYEETCAVTGLRIVNGGGRVEVQAAHIWSVADGGPDIVQNGLALSATCHWLFDRHLISLTEDYGLLVAHNRVPSEFRSLFVEQFDKIRLPPEQRLWPRKDFVARHREKFAEH